LLGDTLTVVPKLAVICRIANIFHPHVSDVNVMHKRHTDTYMHR